MQRKLILTGSLLVAACAAGGNAGEGDVYAGTGHEFIVEGGFGAASATLTLNGERYPMRETGRNQFGVRANPDGDASGRIEIIYNGDGATAYCTVGYVTDGDSEPHRYVVERLECREQ